MIVGSVPTFLVVYRLDARSRSVDLPLAASTSVLAAGALFTVLGAVEWSSADAQGRRLSITPTAVSGRF